MFLPSNRKEKLPTVHSFAMWRAHRKNEINWTIIRCELWLYPARTLHIPQRNTRESYDMMIWYVLPNRYAGTFFFTFFFLHVCRSCCSRNCIIIIEPPKRTKKRPKQIHKIIIKKKRRNETKRSLYFCSIHRILSVVETRQIIGAFRLCQVRILSPSLSISLALFLISRGVHSWAECYKAYSERNS